MLWKSKPSWATLSRDFPGNAEYWRCFERGFYMVGCLCTVLITSVKAPMGSRESNAASLPWRDECCSLWYSRYGPAKGTLLPAYSLLLWQDPQHLVKGRDKNLAHFLMVATGIRTEGERKGRFFSTGYFYANFLSVRGTSGWNGAWSPKRCSLASKLAQTSVTNVPQPRSWHVLTSLSLPVSAALHHCPRRVSIISVSLAATGALLCRSLRAAERGTMGRGAVSEALDEQSST